MTRPCLLRAIIALPLMILAGCASQQASQGDLDAAWAGVALPGSHFAKDTGGTSHGQISSGGIAQTYPEPALGSLLPSSVRDAKGWTQAIMTAFNALQLPATKENLCAAIAVIAQESSFQAEPVVAGLPRIVQSELEKRRDQFHVPNAVMEAALTVKSPDGQTYRERIQHLRTENDLNRLYDDMVSELPLGKTLLGNRNPVKTGGPMQVSLAFAEQKFKAAPYPYTDPRSLREEVFSRRGGLYFGIAYLLDYPVTYDQMLYRFADYNAGHYASRNAGLQSTIRTLSGQSLSLDGDLLRYEGEKPSSTASETLNAVLMIQSLLGLSEETIREDLTREKTQELENTLTWQRITELAKARGKTPPRPQLPEIKLISPKITTGLTTAGFARKVAARFGQCLNRSGI